MDAYACVTTVFHCIGEVISKLSFEFGSFPPATGADILWDEKTTCKMFDFLSFVIMQGYLIFLCVLFPGGVGGWIGPGLIFKHICIFYVNKFLCLAGCNCVFATKLQMKC